MSATPMIMKSLKQSDLMPPKKKFTCWKNGFTTRLEAENTLRAVRRQRELNGEEYMESAFYLCRNCGKYHLTSATQRPTSTGGWTV